MNKKVLILHRILFWANVLMLAATLVYYLIRWGSLGENIGIHFGPDGSFDVIASKVYGFYPHLIGGLIIGGIAAADHFIIKKDMGLRISEKGERLLRAEAALSLDVFLSLWCVYFAAWSWSVSTQRPMVKAVLPIITVLGNVLLFGLTAQVVTWIKFREKGAKKSEDTGAAHRMCRLVAWIMTAGSIGFMLEAWDRLPGDEKLYFDPAYDGLAYIANFGEYMDKRLLVIPHALCIVLLAIFEIVGRRAEKAEKRQLMSLFDKLKLLCGLFFFWWELNLWTEQPIGIVSVGIFTVLCAAALAVYIVKKRKVEKRSENN